MNEHNEYHARLNIHVSDEQIKRVLDYYNNDLNNLKINDIESYNKILYKSYYLKGLELFYLNRSILIDDSLLRFFHDGIATKVHLCKMPANSTLEWHIHADDNTANINIPIQDPNNSLTLFNDASNYTEVNESRPISKVDYHLNSAALLNVKKFHAVFNMADNVRYILMIRIQDPLTYDDVLAYCRKNNLINN